MKKVICSVIMLVSLFMFVGFIGGMECNTISVGEAVTGAVISLLIFAISGKVGDIID